MHWTIGNHTPMEINKKFLVINEANKGSIYWSDIAKSSDNPQISVHN